MAVLSGRDVRAPGQHLDHLGTGEVTRLGGNQDRVWLQRAGGHEGVGRVSSMSSRSGR
jgi:hypothetical protein